jgi:FtsP/CotA-like multicopper oxidase with cupredoxin domain
MAALAGLGTGTAAASFDIPTGAAPSPLFNAPAFSQKLLLFEEFGTQPLPSSAPPASFPEPGGCGGPANPVAYGASLESFLSQPLYPAPTEQANVSAGNPWAQRISTCLGRTVTGVLEGRAPGANFAHQRWSEFLPQVYFQSAMAGSRTNLGFRDSLQRHHYAVGEFGPGGLYHNTTGFSGFDGTTRGLQIRFHPNMPVQDPLHLWTFDGTLPPKLLMAPYGETILFRHYNALPIDDAANGGFGLHTITTHEHNGHNPAESDGFAGMYFFPGEFYDYRWPMVLAGHDSIPIGSTDAKLAEQNSKAGTPDGNGGIRKVRGNWHETMSTHWFHDHMVDFTAQNVYKGNAAMMNYYSAIDRGREPATAAEAQGSSATPGYGCNYADPTDKNPNNVNLCLPSGSSLDWGNRDYDVNLVVADKAWDQAGQLFFNVFNTDGFLGDVATVNFLYKPYLDVRARRYRFRILNGSVSRYWKIALVDATGAQYPFHLVANDGNILEHAVKFPNVESPEGLPEQGIAERYDIVVDFSGLAPGTKLYFVNLLEHQDGKSPKQAIPLAQVLNGSYASGGCPASCDPVVGKFMELRVQAYGGTDLSMNPADYVEGKKAMIPLPGFTKEELANAKERTFEFTRGGDEKPWTIKTDGGQAYNATSVDLLFDRVSAAPTKGGVEIWHIKNGGQGWSHPVHVHFEEGQILQRGGKAPPLWEKGARKDMYRIGPLPDSTDSVDIAIRVREFLGTYVEHCHNTQHEDHSMLLRWDSQNPGQTVAIPTPFPTWDGVVYTNTNTTDVPTFKTGKATDFLTKIATPVANNDGATTAKATAVTIDVLVNDDCVGDCDPATLQITTAPAHGSLLKNADGTVTYSPASTFSGTDSFRYTVRDTTTGTQVSNAATVSVQVLAGTKAAGGGGTSATPVMGTTIQDSVVGMRTAGSDPTCFGCSVSLMTPPQHGTVVVNYPNAGELTYTPHPEFLGTESFSYSVVTPTGVSAAAPVSVGVGPNPVTDVVNIDKASLPRNGNLVVSGSVSALNSAYASLVQVFAGATNASRTGCTGDALGSAIVGIKGGWSYSGNAVPAGSTVCVQSTNLGVAEAKVVQ